MVNRNKSTFFYFLLAVVASDVVTKWLAVEKLQPVGMPPEVIGEHVRFTLVYNPGAAFGLNVGDAATSRWVFTALTIGALLILGRLYLSTRAGDRTRTLALALVCGGAIGNLIDRIRHTGGVVDFLDLGFGSARWPTFNIADMAVSSGAFLLAIVLWAEDRAAAHRHVGDVERRPPRAPEPEVEEVHHATRVTDAVDDETGALHHVGFTSSFKASERPLLLQRLEPFAGGPGFTGKASGGPSRWNRGEESAWEPLHPEMVVEVIYDQVTAGRFRHGTRFLRWRPDKAADQCTCDQLQAELRPAEVDQLLKN